MRRFFRSMMIAAASMAAALSAAPAALAHAHLNQSMPAADSVGPAPTSIMLHFSEPIEARFSGFVLTTAAGATIVAPVAVDPHEPATLIGTPRATLQTGPYRVSWHVVARDGHRMTGAFAFTVR